MPFSVTSRPTIDHEYVFMFSKNKDYYYDADAIREPHVTFSENSKMRGGRNHFGQQRGTPEKGKNARNSNLHKGGLGSGLQSQGEEQEDRLEHSPR